MDEDCLGIGCWTVVDGTLTRKTKEETGTDFHLDNGKPRVDLISPSFLFDVGRVFEFGAVKYGERNYEQHAEQWRWGQLIGSALRHILSWALREDFDQQSGIHHLAHAGANLSMLYDLIVSKKGTDDRTRLRAGD